MNRTIAGALIGAGLILLAACGVDKVTKGDDPANSGASTAASTEPAIAGGWSKASVDSEYVKTAAAQAVASQSRKTGAELKLAAILEAQTQVVAGTNYKLKIRVSEAGAEKEAKVVVWGKLDGSYALTSWE